MDRDRGRIAVAFLASGRSRLCRRRNPTAGQPHRSGPARELKPWNNTWKGTNRATKLSKVYPENESSSSIARTAAATSANRPSRSASTAVS